jgi:phosphatidylserine/phosphatidylglycerophosphate/cardiolipin synthase-like enzyme
MKLFDGSKHSNESNDSKDTIAYAIPTFQMPNSFLQRPLNLPSDTKMTRELLLTASKYDQSASVRLSSAYLNLTPRLLSALTTFGAPYILTAGMISHGFAPKPVTETTKRKTVGAVEKIKASIPEAFLTLVKETAVSILAKGGKVLMYERLGWTFHAKGVWITAGDDKRQAIGDPELIHISSSLVSTIIGSGNYGARSEDLDVESNCIIVFNDSTTDEKEKKECRVKQSVATEWNEMCESSTDLSDISSKKDGGKLKRFALELMKRFL